MTVDVAAATVHLIIEDLPQQPLHAEDAAPMSASLQIATLQARSRLRNLPCQLAGA